METLQLLLLSAALAGVCSHNAHHQVTLSCGDGHTSQPEGLVGPPGKRGPEGARGANGAKGEKGKEGSCQESCPDIKAQLETEIQRRIENLLPSSCRALQSRSNESGVYTVYPFRQNYGKPLEVYCDQSTDHGGWMIIQRRINGTIDFHRTWIEYRNGFGEKGGEYWLGLENLYQITNRSGENYTLRIDLEDWDNQKRYAEYSLFSLGGENTFYQLHIGGYSGTAGDSLNYHNGMSFSTKDADHDNNSGNCGKHGAWWHNTCYQSNLNGKYLNGAVENWSASSWLGFRGHKYSLKSIEMKIRSP